MTTYLGLFHSNLEFLNFFLLLILCLFSYKYFAKFELLGLLMFHAVIFLSLIQVSYFNYVSFPQLLQFNLLNSRFSILFISFNFEV